MSVPLPNVLQAIALTSLVIYIALHWLVPLRPHALRVSQLMIGMYGFFFFCCALTPYRW